MLCLPQKQRCLPGLLFSFFSMSVMLFLKFFQQPFHTIFSCPFQLSSFSINETSLDTEILALTQNINKLKQVNPINFLLIFHDY